MKAIYVDDENLALSLFRRMTGEIAGVTFNVFSNPGEALSYAETNRIDLAFLDIEMPDLGGIELAKKLKEQDPNISVVFVTAYAKYALDAFEVDAIGYLLKPYLREDVDKFIEKKRHILPTYDKSVRIQTMPDFHLFVDNTEIRLGNTKYAEMLAAIVAFGGSISSSNLSFLLWEDSALTEKTMNAFRVAFSRLKNILEENGIGYILSSNKTMRYLDKNAVSCDFFDLLDGKEEAIKGYKGFFLEEYAWAEPIKEKLQIHR
ncbi:MAG TPA: response regulator [Oscillospiraceae bacterium]|nr:response regulator [Oscillospiraceae bacterium]HRW57671.1 response regulator [Oscillospiraceae bacterium]